MSVICRGRSDQPRLVQRRGVGFAVTSSHNTVIPARDGAAGTARPGVLLVLGARPAVRQRRFDRTLLGRVFTFLNATYTPTPNNVVGTVVGVSVALLVLLVVFGMLLEIPSVGAVLTVRRTVSDKLRVFDLRVRFLHISSFVCGNFTEHVSRFSCLAFCFLCVQLTFACCDVACHS